MLDVHSPDHRISGMKDFFVHMATITLGLLIALGLENGVEALHHRHQRKEAETLIRQEIRNNSTGIKESEAGLKTEIDGITILLKSLEAISAGQKPLKIEEKELQFREGPMQDSAWRTANTTGAISYMDYAEVETFSDAYKEQEQLETMEQLTLNDYLQLMPVLKGGGGTIDADRAKVALPYARSAMGHLSGMYFIGVGTMGAYDEALK
jgi:hypothetical protein